MEFNNIIFIDLVALGSLMVLIIWWVYILQRRVTRIENLPSVKDFLKHAKLKNKHK
jgi:hypothetical protein